MTWSWVWGTLVALCFIALAAWIFLTVLEYVLSMRSSDRSQLDDEDEIDHRFY